MMQHLPLLYKHLSITGIDARLFLVEWWVAVFGTVLPVDCLSVTWDLLVFEGDRALVPKLYIPTPNPQILDPRRRIHGQDQTRGPYNPLWTLNPNP